MNVMNTYEVTVWNVPGMAGTMKVMIQAPYTDVAEQMACRQTGGDQAQAIKQYHRNTNNNNGGGGNGFIDNILGLGVIGIVILILL